MMNGSGKSDWLIVPEKPANNGCGWLRSAEQVEGSGQAKGNLERQPRIWTQRQTTRYHMPNRCAQRVSGHPETCHAFVPEAAAQCENSARWYLGGGPPEWAVPCALAHSCAGCSVEKGGCKWRAAFIRLRVVHVARF